MTTMRARTLAIRLACTIVLVGASYGAAQALDGHASAAVQPGALTTEPVLKSAAAGAQRLFGATPAEAPGEVWGAGDKYLVRYTDAGGWERFPDPAGLSGQPLAFFEPLAGRTTASGGVALATRVGEVETSERQEALALRDPGGSFHLVPPPEFATPEPPALGEAEAVEGDGEVEGAEGPEAEEPEGEAPPRPPVVLFGGEPLVAASEEADGSTGAFVVLPAPSIGPQDIVLHYDGKEWQREEICLGTACKEPLSTFRVVAVEATGPGNAWLLGEKGSAEDGIELFTREGGKWRQQKLGAPGTLGGLFDERSPVFGVTVSARSNPSSQLLTATADGLWIDAQVKVGPETFDATTYLDLAPGDARFGELTASWCDATGAGAQLCTKPLGSELASGFNRSFAWPATPSEPFGRRVITGVGQGAILSLAGETFTRIPLSGGEAGTDMGAALDSPEEGWLGRAVGPLRITRQPAASSLAPWPVPFRRPLLAIAPAPGQPVGSLESEALAVGEKGQIARYIPGQGWVAEFLQNSAGVRTTPRLRGVAWPEPGFAYAVGDEGAMWIWRRSTDLWEPDPASPLNLIRGNFTAISFDPAEPTRGYAVGKQGLLLGYGRQWTQEALPPEIPAEANFTSVSFAGDEALATWRYPGEGGTTYIGGVIANDGSGWKVVAEPGSKAIPLLVSGLPDGGAALAFEDGTVTERNGPGAAWTPAPETAGGYPVALAAVREGGVVRSVLSIWTSPPEFPGLVEDREQVQNGETSEAPPLLTKPYALPARGYVERQTATGWRDEQHESFSIPSGHDPTDLPREPDPILSLLVAPDGSAGWAIGGETGQRAANGAEVQTASVMRFGAGATGPVNFRSVPIPGNPGTATFAIGGGAGCSAPCADQMGTGIGPEVWLSDAVTRAATVPGVRGFIYTGPGVATVENESSTNRLSTTMNESAFAREESAYAERLGAGAGAIPVFPTPDRTDVDRAGTLDTFAAAFGGITSVPAGELSRGYYSFETGGEGPPVRVVVLDYAAPALGGDQDCWLAQQLEGAKLAGEPAIVVGGPDLGGQAEDRFAPTDAPETVAILLNGTSPALAASRCTIGTPGAASAYFFDFPEANRTYQLSSGGKTIPAFGSGTLGYVRGSEASDFTGASGFLLASVGAPAPTTDVAPVSVRLIPNVGELALEAEDGTLLRRSSTALFRGLARRPKAGGSCSGNANSGGCEGLVPDPYAPIPTECRGPDCAVGIFPEYRFSSSAPDIADFVEPDPGSANPRSVLLGANGKPIPDPTSGLLCAYNAGTTTVTVEAGGYAYSTVLTVQAGSVQRPCGTVPLQNRPASDLEVHPAILPQSNAPQTHTETPPGTIPPPQLPAQPGTSHPVIPPSTPTVPKVVKVPKPAPHQSLPNFFYKAPQIQQIIPIVPPPAPAAVEPTPPSGTSPVSQPAVSPEPEEEEEAAFDVVHHATAYRPAGRVPAALAAYPLQRSGGHGPPLVYVLPILALLAALSGFGIVDRRHRRAPEPAFLQHRRQGGSE